MTDIAVVPEDLPPAPSAVRIRQVALCVPDTWPVERTVVSELGVAAVHRDPPNVFEMRNVVFAVGDTFLEVLAPTAPSAPSARFLERHGPGGYMLILQVDDLDAARARVDALGIRVAFEMPMDDVHGVRAGALHLHPADTGGTLISLDRMDPPDAWAWAGRAWEGHVHTDVTTGIVGVELTSADPQRLLDRLSLLLGSAAAGGRIALDRGTITVRAGAPDARDHLSGIDFAAGPAATPGTTHTVGATRLRLV